MKVPKIQYARLEKMADYIEKLPPRVFDMEFFGVADSKKVEHDPKMSCGFVGCAMGHAAHDKLFKGLTLVYDPIEDLASTSGQEKKYYFRVKYDGEEQMGAAQKLFGILEAETDSLFGAQLSGLTPKKVAKRIRLFCENAKNVKPATRRELGDIWWLEPHSHADRAFKKAYGFPYNPFNQ